ncbi:hypothetical protein M0D21_20405 [Aquimarina sp. D1M17]|uniref:methionyl-tRNA formyltransferase n=1 Tax=Aquimarina acroporae TaxID=2937283 RepID=UPI0020BEE07D|nr:formyltransferase family protein [Aquimarina acroporae]MCK8523951.1 hypothetical protein [Aquimarina acroporae]
MKVSLYLMSQKGFEVLKALKSNGYEIHISEIIVGRDKNVKDDFSEKIISYCLKNEIKHYERKDSYVITSDFSIAISWRWLIPESKSKLIVLHDSLLPKYRGFSPLVNMLINKEEVIGVTALFASKEYDKGPIIEQSSTEISYPIKISDAINIITNNYVELVLKIVEKIRLGEKITTYQQNEKLATYSLWRDEEDYEIDWNQSAESILNLINAVSKPYKGASTFINGNQKIRILDASIEDDVHIENRDAGKVIFIKENCPVIVCKTGLIKLSEVIDDNTEKNILPFKKFRIRLTSQTPYNG